MNDKGWTVQKRVLSARQCLITKLRGGMINDTFNLGDTEGSSDMDNGKYRSLDMDSDFLIDLRIGRRSRCRERISRNPSRLKLDGVESFPFYRAQSVCGFCPLAPAAFMSADNLRVIKPPVYTVQCEFLQELQLIVYLTTKHKKHPLHPFSTLPKDSVFSLGLDTLVL
ncbi:hypothetical protein J6590_028753 [Homalodisca vitripennis]|nr:hypothetical protein J6590_028753 [Homalodisca vitripennis]